jgi:hypothetical protein
MVSVHQIVAGLLLGSLGVTVGFQTPAVSRAEAKSPPPASGEIIQTKQTASQAYTQAMLAGYNATARRDYHTALINFRRALAARPGDRYATAAIRNMETYIAQQRAEAAKQAEIARLQETISEAVEANDWACAAASVDRLVTLVPPDSTDRARLIAYRGEIGGFIQSRDNLDQWSSICPGGQV